MRVELMSDDGRDEWQALIDRSPDATFGHLWAWRDIIRTAYGFKSYYFVARDDSGRAVAAIPFISMRSMIYGNELASMPYIEYGGVCHATSLDPERHAEVDRAIFDHVLRLASSIKAKRVHVRNKRVCDARFDVSTEKVVQTLELCGTSDEQMKRLPSERRNRLKRCAKNGLVSESVAPGDPIAFDRFCAIYDENMRDLGSPTHSRLFFSEVMARLKDIITLVLVRHDGIAIGAGAAVDFRGELSMPWSGATLAARPLYATNQLYWAAITLAIERRCRIFDFGRSSKDSGIYEFKRQWGPTPHQSYWCTYYLKRNAKPPKARRELQLASAVWRRMPLTVARLVGPRLRKGISN